MSAEQRDIDFEVLREPWNKYELDDGSYLKTKYILTKFRKSEPDEQNRIKIGVDGQTLTVTYNVPKELKGPATTRKYTPEETKNAIQQEVGYKTIAEEWNEYIAEDGTKIRVKDTVTRISRTNLADKNGDPIYFVEHSTMVQGAPPKR